MPNTLYTNYYYSKFREELIKNVSIISLFNLEYEVFEDAETGGSSIFVFGKNKIKNTKLFSSKTEDGFFNSYRFCLNQAEYSFIPDNKFLFSGDSLSLWKKTFKGSIALGANNFQFYNGIKTGNNKKFLSEIKLDDRYKPVIRGRDFYKYTQLKNKIFVLFDPEQLWSNTNEDMYLVEEKLIFRQTSDHLVVTLDTNKNFTMDTTHLLFDKSNKFSHKYLLVVLNSKLLNFLYQIIVPEIGKTFSEVKGVNLKKLPVKEIALENQQLYIEKANILLELNKKIQEKKEKFISRIQNNLEVNKITNKLSVFYDNDFSIFLKELKKQKVVLTLHQQDEWEEYFNTYKNFINPVQTEIVQTDKEIDHMIYDLYDLSKEERQLVEST